MNHPWRTCWSTLRDRRTSPTEREDAFERLLQLTRGFWTPNAPRKDATLLESVYGRARALFYVLARNHPVVIDPNDVAHDALVKLFEKAPTIDDPERWLTGTIRNMILKLVTQQQPLVPDGHEEIARHPAPTTECQDTTASESASAELRQAVESAIRSLPPAVRKVAELCIRDGLSPVDASRLLGMKPATTRKNLERARVRLRRDLSHLRPSRRSNSYRLDNTVPTR